MSAHPSTLGDEFELRDLNGGSQVEHTDPEPYNRSEHSNTLHESSLPPVDRGFGAWSFLTAAFLTEGLVWGFPNAYGIFLLKYMEDSRWSSQKHASTLLPLIGPIASGIMYCAAPVTYPMTARFPRHRRPSHLLGVLLMFGSLFGASYAKTIPTLLVLQGILYAIGGAILYASAIYYMSEWFVERRGLANGVVFAGTAWGGLVLPLILPPVIDKHGIAQTLRFYAVVSSAVLVLSLPFIRGRLSAPSIIGPTLPRMSNFFWLKDKTFWTIAVANTLQGLAYFVPLLWLPTYVSSIHLSANDAAISLAVLNAASLVGRLGLGFLSDIFSPWALASTILILTALSIFVLWGVLSFTFAGVLAYSIVYGCLASGWTSLWARFLRPIAKEDPSLTTTLLGVFSLSRGIGNILSTPISTALQPSSSSAVQLRPGGAYHGQYENVILYAGTCFAAAAIVVGLGWFMHGTTIHRRSTAA